MTDYVLPPDLVASEIEWTLFDNSAVFSSPLSGAVRTVSRPGTRWGVRMVFRAVSTQDRRRLMSMIAALRGRTNRIWVTDPSYTLSGSMPCPELITNSSPVVNTTGWTSSNAELVLSADSAFGLRFTRAGVTAAQNANQAGVTIVNAARYAVQFSLAQGKGNIRMSMRCGSTSGGSEMLSGTTYTAAGRFVAGFAATATTGYFNIRDFITGRNVGDFQFVPWVSAARCAIVNGGSQTGSSLLLSGMPTSTAGLARAGDWIEVNGELKRLIADLDSDSSGGGTVLFEPALRASPADATPVVFRNPMGKFLLAEDSVSYGTRPGIISDIELSLVEDIT